MPDVLIRGLDDSVLRQLRAAAQAHGRSLQAEIHYVLESAAAKRVAGTRRLSQAWLGRLKRGGGKHSDSTALIRGDRDRR